MTLEEKIHYHKTHGGTYVPMSQQQLYNDTWDYIFAYLDNYDKIVFEYNNDISGFTHHDIKSKIIKLGGMIMIGKNFILKHSKDMPVNLLFIYESDKLKIIIELL